jgi:hypothetical protein
MPGRDVRSLQLDRCALMAMSMSFGLCRGARACIIRLEVDL